ncbi:MAG TPA: fumarate hydratase [Firmicutes bacterium]|nr:fumarate hydratase [Bacillota bacterium]
MKTADLNLLEQKIAEAIEYIACNMESSCRAALEKARESEENPTARFALDVMCDNADIAAKNGFPVCQDTGMAVVFLYVGRELKLDGDIYKAVNDGVRRGYKMLRKSVLDPVTRVNTGDNTPAVIHTQIVEGEKIRVEIMLKGFGSENMSKVYMLNPAQGLEEAKRLIIDSVAQAGSNPCPPVIVGVGLGGTLEKACELSKHALFRKLGSSNPDTELDNLEKYLLGEINKLGVGAQGFGGNTTALGVFIEKYPTHISSLPVAVNMLCHCSRATSFEI